MSIIFTLTVVPYFAYFRQSADSAALLNQYFWSTNKFSFDRLINLPTSGAIGGENQTVRNRDVI